MCTTATSGSKACARSSSLPYALWWRTSPPSLGSLPKRAWAPRPGSSWRWPASARWWSSFLRLASSPGCASLATSICTSPSAPTNSRCAPASSTRSRCTCPTSACSPWTSGRRSFSDCSACVRFPSTRPEARRTRPSWCPTSPRPRPSGCAPSSTTARTLWPLRLPLRRAWRVQRVRPRRAWRVRATRFRSRWGPALRLWPRGRRPLPATCRARPPRATCSMWAPRHGTKWAACSPALLRIPAALPTSTVSLTRSCSSRVFPTPHRWGSSSPVWLSACCKSSVSSST